MYHGEYENIDTLGVDYALAEDMTYYRWFGTGVTELMLNTNKTNFILNYNSLEHNTMFEKEAKAMEKAMESVGQIPALQSKLDSVTEKVNKMKFLSPEDYVECESCGLLVNEGKAQVFSSVETKNTISFYFTLSGLNEAVPHKKEAVLHHLCQHCDMKKFKKEKKY